MIWGKCEVIRGHWPQVTSWNWLNVWNSTLAMSWPNHAQILSFASMASRQGAVKHGFVIKIAGGCSSYDVIAPWPDLTWSIFFHQKLRKVFLIRYPKPGGATRRCFFAICEKPQGDRVHPLSGRGLNMKELAPLVITTGIILWNCQDSRDKRQQNLITYLVSIIIWRFAKLETRSIYLIILRISSAKVQNTKRSGEYYWGSREIWWVVSSDFSGLIWMQSRDQDNWEPRVQSYL